jgi:Rap1a immunity proteins
MRPYVTRPYVRKIFGLPLLSVLATGLAFAGNNSNTQSDTVAKADTEQTAPIAAMSAMAKTDAAVKVEPVVKMIAPKAEASEPILPPPDGNELAQSCKAEAEGFDAGYCLGVVEGVIASMRLCKRDRSVITLGEAADAAAKYLASHPDRLKERDVVLARKALSQAYPCGVSRR